MSHMFPSETMLVATPSPYDDESYMGFLLRTAEENATSLYSLFTQAGLTENEMRLARPPMEKLKPLFGNGNQLERMGEVHTKNGRYIPLRNHLMPSLYLRSKHARVCTRCVNENGYIEAFWELRHAVACPRHAQFALSKCPSCERTIDWNRSGLNSCKCGFQFEDAPEQKVKNPATLALLGVLYSKLNGVPLNSNELDYVQFPQADLELMSLSTLIALIVRLEQFVEPDSNKDETEVLGIEAGGEIFSQWPMGFYRYLDRVHSPTTNKARSGLRGQFASFYESIFKAGIPKTEVEFLRNAFADYGNQFYKQASLHPLLKTGLASNIVGIEGLAKKLGKQPSTVRKLVAAKLIPVYTTQQNGRKLFDISMQTPFEFATGKSLSLEKASELLDIPATVLKAYRTKGHYSPRHLATPSTLYHEKDILEIKASLLQGCGTVQLDELRQITMSKIMLKKLGESSIKAAFISAVEKREIFPIGKLTDRIGDLVFDSRVVKSFLDKLQETTSASISLEKGMQDLEIHSDCLNLLIGAGHLDVVQTTLGPRLKSEAFHTFNDNYVSVRAVAGTKGITQRAVLELCKNIGIQVINLSKKNQPLRNHFIRRSQLPLIGLANMSNEYMNAA